MKRGRGLELQRWTEAVHARPEVADDRNSRWL
jgi:hypothetical protein